MVPLYFMKRRIAVKVFGKYMGGYTRSLFAVGSYAAFDVDWIHVERYNSSDEKDNRCLLRFGSSYWTVDIKSADGDYIDPETANTLVKAIATKDTLDLEKYRMGFFEIIDIRPDSICITNAFDEDYNTIPLEVVGV